MPSTGFRTSKAASERAWELYHENSKRGRRLGVAGVGPASARPQAVAPSGDTLGPSHVDTADGWISLAPAAVPIGPPARDALAASSLSRFLETVGGAIADPGPVHLVLHIHRIDALPEGLYRFRPESRALQPMGGEDIGRRLWAAMAAETTAPPLMMFIVGRLDGAAMAEGERGYRRALMAAGRQAHVIGRAAEPAGLWCQELAGFYDREVDALLSLDGLSRSVLCAMALGTIGHGGGRRP